LDAVTLAVMIFVAYVLADTLTNAWEAFVPRPQK